MTTEMNMSEVIDEVKNATEDELKQVIEQHFEAVRMQGMKIGAGYMAAAIHGVIVKNLKKGFDSSLRDYQRAIKAIEEIVRVQLTTQNDLEDATVSEEIINDGTAE